MAPARRVAVLLGAGASKDAGIPTTVEMTDEVISRMINPLHLRALEFIHNTLIADAAARAPGEPSFRGFTDEPVTRSRVDVERLFASVELLIDRHKQPWSPFVASWSPGLDSFSSGARVTELDLAWQFNRFEKELDRFVNSLDVGRTGRIRRGSARDVSRGLAQGIASALGRARATDVSSVLTAVRGDMLASLFDILTMGGPAKVRYLMPIARIARRQRSVAVATLNYDRTLEVASREAGVRCETGIETWLQGGELAWSDTGVRLLKLHGSIDWVIDESEQQSDLLPFQRIAKLDGTLSTPSDARPAVVFGEAGKLRSEGPYIELLLAFATELKSADSLVVVGYSFRDHHVNEIVARWLSGDAARRIVVLEPRPLDSYGHDSFAHRVAALGDRSSKDEAPPRVLHIRKKAREGITAAIRAARAEAPVKQTAAT